MTVSYSASTCSATPTPSSNSSNVQKFPIICKLFFILKKNSYCCGAVNLKVQHMTLKQKARELLINRPVWLTYEIIERETGIPTGWLNALKRGKMKQPKKDRLEILINYFKKTLHAD